MEKKHTGLKVLVVILTVLVLALGGFIVYDKVLSKNGNTANNQPTDNNIVDKKDNNKNTDTIEVSYNTLNDYQREIDAINNEAIKLKKNIKVHIEDIKIDYTFSSTDFYINTFKINNRNITYEVDNLIKNIIKFNDYIAIESFSPPYVELIQFFDMNGNLITSFNNEEEKFHISEFATDRIYISNTYFLSSYLGIPGNAIIKESISEYCEGNYNAVHLIYSVSLDENKVVYNLEIKECTFKTSQGK